MVSRTHCYAEGGKVVKDHTAPKKPPAPPPPPPSLGSGMAAKAGDTLANKRKKQMEDLGLKNGGPVRKRKR